MTCLIDRKKEPVVKGFERLSIPYPNVTTLPNGLELYALDAGDQPINRITVSFSSGLMEAAIPDSLQLAVQLLREGTAAYSGSTISETLDYHGAWLKCDALSHNSSVNLWSLNRSTSKLLPLLGEILTKPSFPEKAFATLRDKHKSRYLLSQKNVSFMASRNDKKLVFGASHPINRMIDAEGIDTLSTDDIWAAYRQAFTPAPRLFVAGNIKEILPAVSDFFGRLDYNATVADQNIIDMQPLPGSHTSVIDVDAEHQAAIAVSIPTIGRNHPDYIALRLVIMALGGYFGSRLMANIREDKGYTYGIQANLLGYREGGVISIMTETAPQYIDAVINEVKHELIRLREQPMPDDELFIVKNNAMTSLAATLDTPFSIMDLHISQFHTGTPENYFEKQLEVINSLSAPQILELSQKYLDIDRLLISIARPAHA